MTIRELVNDDVFVLQSHDNILAAAKPEMEALRDRARAGRTSMESLDVNDPDYGSKLQNASTEIGALASEAALLYGRLRADVYAVLTPAQQAEADQAKGELKERFRRHRQHGPAE